MSNEKQLDMFQQELDIIQLREEVAALKERIADLEKKDPLKEMAEKLMKIPFNPVPMPSKPVPLNPPFWNDSPRPYYVGTPEPGQFPTITCEKLEPVRNFTSFSDRVGL